MVDCPERSASLLSRVWFCWMSPLLAKGAKKTLTSHDLWELDADERAASLCGELSSASDDPHLTPAFLRWIGVVDTPTARRLWHIAQPTLVPSAALMVLYSAAQLTLPLVVGQILRSIVDNTNDGAYWAIILLASSLIGMACNQLHLHLAFRTGTRLRAAVIAEIFRTTLSLTEAQRTAFSSGELTNLISSDAQKLQEMMRLINMLWSAPLLVVVSTVFLIRLMGPSGMLGIAVLAFMVPVSKKIAASVGRYRKLHLPVVDGRLRLAGEVLSGIRVCKYFGWESLFVSRLLAQRSREMYYVRREVAVWALSICSNIFAPIIATLVAFSSFSSWQGEVLTPETVFTSLLFFNVLRFPLNYVGEVLTLAAQAKVAVGRLDSFFKWDAEWRCSSSRSVDSSPIAPATLQRALEVTDASNGAQTETQTDSPGIDVNSSTAFIVGHETTDTVTVRGVDLHVRPGKVAMIVGPVGAGKSVFLSGLLGETASDGGGVFLRGRVAYASQTPFVLNDTLKNNVLFGQPFDAERYHAVLSGCALISDLAQLPGGDETEIGERGVTLSGGQKQRVSLARLAYAQPDVAIMDDPFSALDAETAGRVFRALVGQHGLLSNSAVLLSTHATQLLPMADFVVVMHDCNAAYCGAQAGLKSGLEQLMDSAAAGDKSTDANNDLQSLSSLATSLHADVISAEQVDASADDPSSHDPSSHDPSSHDPSVTTKATVATSAPVSSTRLSASADGQLVQDETLGTGRLGWATPLAWLRAAGGWKWATLQVIFLALDRTTYVVVEWWMAKWASAADREPGSPWGDTLPRAVPREGANFYIKWYIVLGCINLVVLVTRTEWFVHGGANAAAALGKSLHSRVFTSPMLFFETTPLGRVMNRFAFDLENIDYALIQKINATQASIGWMLSGIAVMIGINVYMALVLLPVLMLFYMLQRYYRSSSVDLQRLDSTSRSPVQATFAEVLDGATTIRAFGAVQRFVSVGDAGVDANNRALIAFTAAQRWLGVRLDTLGAIVAFFAAILGWALRTSIEPGLIGMCILWSTNFSISLNFFVVFSTEAEAMLTSVERVVEYCDLPQEAERQTTTSHPGTALPECWPAVGKVEFRDVELRYRPGLELALRGTTLTIEGGERVGVVGRTGAGKSSLAVAMFRLVEPCGGAVWVDGVSLSTLGLNDVRGRDGGLCIIPQEPVIFSGSLRDNLDPFGGYSDDALWDALSAVRMRSTVVALGKGLGAAIEEGGDNFSVGQRQLLCLARAILRKPRVLLLDEATASVDLDTDAFIQRAVRTCFRHCTLITVAHRLATIVDYDRVVVMRNGVVAEQGTPYDLLHRDDGEFSQLVRMSVDADKLRVLVGEANQKTKAKTVRESQA